MLAVLKPEEFRGRIMEEVEGMKEWQMTLPSKNNSS